MIRRPTFTPTLLAAAIAATTAACAPAPNGTTTGTSNGGIDDPNIVGVSLSLTVVQSDAKCHRATFTGPSTIVQTFTPVAGSTTPVALTGLQPGTFSLLVEAFNVACASLVATTPVTWTSTPVNVTLALGSLTPVTIYLKRPAAAAVVLDYDTSQLIWSPPAGGTGVSGLAVLAPKLYVVHGGTIDRLSVLGGSVEAQTISTGVQAILPDPTGLFFSASTPNAGTYYLPTGEFQRQFTTQIAAVFAPAPGGFVAVAGGTIQRFTTSTGTATTLLPYSAVGTLLLTDSTYVYYTYGTNIGRVPLAGGASTILWTIPNGTIYGFATDGTSLYWSQTSGQSWNNGIFTIPVTATMPAQTVTLVTNGFPDQVVVDATNVYYNTHTYNNDGSACDSSISRVAKAGGAPTPVWSRANVCSDFLAQTTTSLYFDGGYGASVYKLDK